MTSMSRGKNLGSLMYFERYCSRLVKDFSLRPARAASSLFRLKCTLGVSAEYKASGPGPMP